MKYTLLAVALVATTNSDPGCGGAYQKAEDKVVIQGSRFDVISKDEIPGHAAPYVTVFKDRYTGRCFVAASSGSSDGGISLIETSADMCALPKGEVEKGK